jgi:hypothetical protein
MPQTYIRAVGPGAVGRTEPVAVSYNRSGGAEPGIDGNEVDDQVCMTIKLRVSDAPASWCITRLWQRTRRTT